MDDDSWERISDDLRKELKGTAYEISCPIDPKNTKDLLMLIDHAHYCMESSARLDLGSSDATKLYCGERSTLQCARNLETLVRAMIRARRLRIAELEPQLSKGQPTLEVPAGSLPV